MIRILTICTGNICRSPLAAQLLRAKLPAEHYQLESAGTAVLTGERSPLEAQRAALRMGASGVEEHRARLLTPESALQADLILGMERMHRREIARTYPTAAKRAFTLLEFAHVTSRLDDEELKTLMQDHLDSKTPALDVIARMRGVVPRLPDVRRYDVEDPFGRSQQVYQRAARQIDIAVDRVVTFFDRASRLHLQLPTGRPSMLAPPPG